MAESRPTTQLALLRAVNVGGHGKVSMADLRRTLERAGFTGVQTLMQTGHLILRDAPADETKLQRLLESALQQGLGLTTDVFVRSPAELAEVIAKNPFASFAKDDPSHLLVVFHHTPFSNSWLRAAQASITGPESIEAVGRHLYITYPDGIGRSRLRLPPQDDGHDVRGTARNWNTVLKLVAALKSAA